MYSLKSTLRFAKWFDKLDEAQRKEISKLLLVLKTLGHEMKLPHSRALGEGIFELRDSHFGLRVYYGFWQNEIFLLQGGNKNSQNQDILAACKLFKKTIG